MISSKFRRYTSVGKIFSEFFFFFLEINCEPEQTSAGTKNIYEKKKNKITEYIGKVEKSTKILYIKWLLKFKAQNVDKWYKYIYT